MRGGIVGNDITETRRVQIIYDRSQQTMTVYEQMWPVGYFVNKITEIQDNLITYCLRLL